MVPIKLQLHNFLSYREPAPLDFRSFNLAVLSGNNGVGKSSILEAITWAIWGKTRAASDDDLIHQGTTGCWVEFVFEHEESLYRIVRKRELKGRGQSFLELQTRKGKSSSLLADDHWQSIAEATLKATQEKIIRILKIPYEIFVNSSYLRQGHADEFTIKTPAERKEILADILGLNYYEELAQKAREKTRQQEEKTKLLAFQIEDLQEQIARKKEVENQYKQIEKDFSKEGRNLKVLKNKISKLEKQSKEFEITNEKLSILREQFSRLQQETQELALERKTHFQEKTNSENQLKNKEKIFKRYQQLLILEKDNEQEAKKIQKYSDLQQQLKVIEHIKGELENNVSRINKISTCPMCLRPMKKDESAKIVEHLEVEFKEKYAPKLNELQQEIKQLNYDQNRHQKIQEQLKDVIGVREEKQSLDLAENNLKNINTNLKRVHERFTKIKAQARKITKEGKELKSKLPTLEKARFAWQEKKQEEENLAGKILDLQNNLGALRQELTQIEKQEKELKETQKQQEEAQKESQIYEELSVTFGKKGIQAMIIEQSLRAIEEEANELLRKVTDGRMSLRFITQKAKKAAADEEPIETLEIKIADELGGRDYEMYSGGEAFRINFAIRIAISRLLAARAGAHLKFLAIDEGFGMLDAPGRDDLVAAINSIAGDFEKILVITHIPELKDLFPTKIEVTKDEEGSHLEVVGT